MKLATLGTGPGSRGFVSCRRTFCILSPSKEHPASLPALEGIESGKAVGPEGPKLKASKENNDPISSNFWKQGQKARNIMKHLPKHLPFQKQNQCSENPQLRTRRSASPDFAARRSGNRPITCRDCRNSHHVVGKSVFFTEIPMILSHVRVSLKKPPLDHLKILRMK